MLELFRNVIFFVGFVTTAALWLWFGSHGLASFLRWLFPKTDPAEFSPGGIGAVLLLLTMGGAAWFFIRHGA